MFRLFIYVAFCFAVAVPWMVGVKTIHDYIFGGWTIKAEPKV